MTTAINVFANNPHEEGTKARGDWNVRMSWKQMIEIVGEIVPGRFDFMPRNAQTLAVIYLFAYVRREENPELMERIDHASMYARIREGRAWSTEFERLLGLWKKRQAEQ